MGCYYLPSGGVECILTPERCLRSEFSGGLLPLKIKSRLLEVPCILPDTCLFMWSMICLYVFDWPISEYKMLLSAFVCTLKGNFFVLAPSFWDVIKAITIAEFMLHGVLWRRLCPNGIWLWAWWIHVMSNWLWATWHLIKCPIIIYHFDQSEIHWFETF